MNVFAALNTSKGVVTTTAATSTWLLLNDTIDTAGSPIEGWVAEERYGRRGGVVPPRRSVVLWVLASRGCGDEVRGQGHRELLALALIGGRRKHVGVQLVRLRRRARSGASRNDRLGVRRRQRCR